MNAEGLIRAVFDETRSLVAVDDALTAFASRLSSDLPLIEVSPRALPVTDRIGDLLTVASEETRGLVAAIAAASAALFAGEFLSRPELIGGALVIAAGLVEVWPVRKAAPRA